VERTVVAYLHFITKHIAYICNQGNLVAKAGRWTPLTR